MGNEKHIDGLIANLGDVDRLVEIHGQITTKGPGRKHDVHVLNRSAIVLVVACWEAFVEDLAEATLKHMLSAAKDHSVFPKFVLEEVASRHSGLHAWKLAGDGWRKVLRGNLEGVLLRTTGRLNTPRTTQVDDLFHRTVGLSDLSSSWYWPNRSVAQTTKALDDLVTLRGSIAHRVTTSSSVRLKEVRDALNLISRLSVKSHNRAVIHLITQIDECSWDMYSFRKTK